MFKEVVLNSLLTKSPDTPTLDTINHLRRKLRESMRQNALLTAERARNEALLILAGTSAETPRT